MNKTNFRKFEIENMFGSENAQKSCLQFSACRQRRKLIILSNLIENGIEGMAVGSTCGERRNEKLEMARLRGLRDPPKRQKTVSACRGGLLSNKHGQRRTRSWTCHDFVVCMIYQNDEKGQKQYPHHCFFFQIAIFLKTGPFAVFHLKHIPIFLFF